MSDLVAFLTARLDEDEAAAKRASRDKAAGDEWLAGDAGDGWTRAGTPVLRPDGNAAAVAIGDYAADHIALHDPARVLREVAAGRKVLAWYADSLDASETFREKLGTGTHMATAAESYLNVIQLLAAVYAGHPGYDPAWAPPA